MNTAVSKSQLPPVIKTIQVPWTTEEAFSRFTTQISDWWPKKIHSVAEDDELEVGFELDEGGLVYEQKGDHHAVWAEVLLWEPPHRFILNWHPGREAESGGTLEVRFKNLGEGCQVKLTHSGWEKYGSKAVEMRKGYSSGWDYVLGLYAN
jgi:uncharacterized protein YndB with AHSA1/START domain